MTEATRLLVCTAAWLLMSTSFAADKPFTGTFEGSGRQCDGKLLLREKTVEWRTPFASCKQTPYRILKKELDGVRPQIVLLLRGKRCGFEVIDLYLDPQYPTYWSVIGYRSQSDYEQQSADRLTCSVDKLER